MTDEKPLPPAVYRLALGTLQRMPWKPGKKRLEQRRQKQRMAIAALAEAETRRKERGYD